MFSERHHSVRNAAAVSSKQFGDGRFCSRDFYRPSTGSPVHTASASPQTRILVTCLELQKLVALEERDCFLAEGKSANTLRVFGQHFTRRRHLGTLPTQTQDMTY